MNSLNLNSGPPRRKTTRRQLEEMLNFVQNNKIVLSGKTKPTEAGKIKILWQQFAVIANSFGDGPQKSGEQWRHVFNEWKMNTKRKSRRILHHVGGTGGGPPAGKELSDLEKQLLELISKIHLGDLQIEDSLVCGPSSGVSNVTSIENEAGYFLLPSTSYEDFNSITVIEEPTAAAANTDVLEENIENKGTINSSDSNDFYTTKSEPAVPVIKETPCKKKMPPTPTSRYASVNIREACQEFNAAQKAIATKEAAALENSKELLKIEKGKLKLKYYKIFGNFNNFNEFYENI